MNETEFKRRSRGKPKYKSIKLWHYKYFLTQQIIQDIIIFIVIKPADATMGLSMLFFSLPTIITSTHCPTRRSSCESKTSWGSNEPVREVNITLPTICNRVETQAPPILAAFLARYLSLALCIDWLSFLFANLSFSLLALNNTSYYIST